MDRKSILIKNPPTIFLNKKIIKNHFSQFGEITDVVISVRTNSCLVTFFHAAQAEEAKSKGSLWKGKQLDIIWEDSRMDDVVEDELYWGIDEVVDEPKEKISKPSNYKLDTERQQRKSYYGEEKDYFIPNKESKNERRGSPSSFKFDTKYDRRGSPSNEEKAMKSSFKFDSKSERRWSPSSLRFESKSEQRSSPTFEDKLANPSSFKFESKSEQRSSPSFEDKLANPSSFKFEYKSEQRSSPSFEDKPANPSSFKFESKSEQRSSPSFGDKSANPSSFEFESKSEQRWSPSRELKSWKSLNFKFESKNEQRSSLSNEEKPVKPPISRFEIKNEPKRPPIDLKPTKAENEDVIKFDESLMEKVAFSSNEQLSILEERDKFIRLTSNKSIQPKSDSVVRGTCPDMCPEKERVLRVNRGMVAPYETNEDGSVNHKLFVKEYTRSSADQEEPLPHELRPEPVLTMTMEYLITQIMCKIDNEDENLGNWFDFCWGRLRAIRKDIIQQQLCDLNTVRIVEQCARFHLVCFDRLWSLPSTVFDEKINTETLMNCLQSLMHMYDDLRRQSITCPNEAEFRGYLILLKLNSGYLLSEYQQFTDELQNSTEVKHAARIHTAYSNNMYATFFKLVKSTTYLNACLMQRFFGHIRTNALDVIVKASCPPNKMVKIPLDFMMDHLKFDQPDDCITFCEASGFDYVNNTFIISRNNFYFPGQLFIVPTPSELVVQKRMSVPQAVCGNEPIPLYLEHSIHSSFTENNTLKEESIDASDQEEKMLRDIVERKLHKKRLLQENESMSLADVALVKPSVVKDNFYENVVDISDEEMEEDVVIEDEKSEATFEESEDMSTDMEESDGSNWESDQSANVPEPECAFNKFSFNQINKMSSFPVDSSTNSVFKLPHTTFQSTASPFPTKSSSPPQSKQVSPPLFKKPWTPSPIVKKPMTPPGTTMKKPQFFVPIPKSPSPVRTHHVKSPSPVISHPVKLPSPVAFHPIKSPSPLPKTNNFKFTPKTKHINDENIVMAKLKKKLNEKMKKTTARKFLRLWKLKVEKIKRARERVFIDHINISVKDHLNLWGISNSHFRPRISERLENRKKTGLVIAAILHTNIVDQIDKEVNKVSGFVAEILGKNAILSAHNHGNIAQPHPVFWKLVFALPEQITGGSTFPTKLRMWCKAAFYPDSSLNIGEVFYKKTNSGVPIFTSVEIIEGIGDINKKCHNTSALIIVRAEGWEKNLQTLDRLNRILSATTGKIPVAIMTIKRSSHVVELPIKSPKIIHLHQDNWDKTEHIVKAIGVLAKHTYLYNLKVQPLGFAIEVLTDKFLDALHEDKFSNEGLLVLLTNPNNVIDFYNEFIDKIEREIKDCCLFNLYGTACEFKSHLTKSLNSDSLFPQHYNNPNFKMILANHMESLKLKHIKWTFKNSLDLLAVFKDYCQDLKCPQILSMLMRLINPPDVDSGIDLYKYLECISWLPIVEIIIKQAINKELYNFIVVYRYHKIQELIDSHWWLSSDIVIKTNQSFLPTT